MKKEIVENILQGKTPAEYIALMVFAFLGLVISAVIEVIRARKKIKAKGGFSLKVWLLDNSLRVFLSMMIISIGVLYTEDIGRYLGISIGVGQKSALVMGFMTDKIIEALMTVKIPKKSKI
jgi:hypothetical protein